jgi:hypothetical protein
VEIAKRESNLIRVLSEQVIDQLQWRAGDKRDGKTYIVKGMQYPFSPHKTLRQLARAAAALRGVARVDSEAISEVENIAAFMRYDRAEEI